MKFFNRYKNLVLNGMQLEKYIIELNTETMKTTNEYPKERNRISEILGYAEEREMDDTNEEENSDDEEVKKYEDEDSSHYSVGGDNGL